MSEEADPSAAGGDETGATTDGKKGFSKKKMAILDRKSVV